MCIINRLNCDKHTWNTTVAMYIELDPEMSLLYLFSPVTRHPFLSPFTWAWRGENRECMLRERERGSVDETDRDIFHTPSPSLRPVRSQDVSPLLSSPLWPTFLPLSNQTGGPLLHLLSRPRQGWAHGAEKDPRRGPIQLHPTPSPHFTQAVRCFLLGLAFAGGGAFLQPVTPCCWRYTAWSGMFSVPSSLSFFFIFCFILFFSFEFADRCGLHLWGTKMTYTKQTLTLE